MLVKIKDAAENVGDLRHPGRRDPGRRRAGGDHGVFLGGGHPGIVAIDADLLIRVG